MYQGFNANVPEIPMVKRPMEISQIIYQELNILSTNPKTMNHLVEEEKG